MTALKSIVSGAWPDKVEALMSTENGRSSESALHIPLKTGWETEASFGFVPLNPNDLVLWGAIFAFHALLVKV